LTPTAQGRIPASSASVPTPGDDGCQATAKLEPRRGRVDTPAPAPRGVRSLEQRAVRAHTAWRILRCPRAARRRCWPRSRAGRRPIRCVVEAVLRPEGVGWADAQNPMSPTVAGRRAATRLGNPPAPGRPAAAPPWQATVGEAATQGPAGTQEPEHAPGVCAPASLAVLRAAATARCWASASPKGRPEGGPSASLEAWSAPRCRGAGYPGSRASGWRSGPSRAPASHPEVRRDSGQVRGSSSPRS
jgi:hypothetical protein